MDASTTERAETSGGYALSRDGAIPGLVWAFRIHEDGAAEPLPVVEPIDERHDGWVWVHINLVDSRACHWLRSLDLPPAAIALVASRDNHQQLHATDSCVYGVFSDLSRDLGENGDEFAHLHFLMTERLLISGRHRPLAAVDKVREVVQQGSLRLSSVAALLELIVDHIADAVDRLADRMAADLDKIEDALAAGVSPAGSRKDLGAARRTSVKVHRQLSGLRTLFHRMEREGTEGFGQRIRIAAGKLAQRLDALDHDIVEVRDRARLLQEEINAAVAEASNRALNILAVITTIFLPPTLVTGVFGMNIKGLPFAEDADGFLWVAGAMAISAAAVYYLMKRIGAVKF